MKAEEIIFDKVYESSMEKRLEQTRELLQNLVDSFNALDLKPCGSAADLWGLIHHPKEIVAAAQYGAENDVEGLTDSQRENYLAKLQHKNPNALYLLAQKCAIDPYTEKGQALWTINKNGKVDLNHKEAHGILKARSVFASNERQKKCASDMMQMRDLFNSINQTTGGLLHSLSSLFKPPARPDQEELPRSFDIEAVRKILNAV